ncbi:MAG TPA: hypothetical protein VFQ38_18530 [Longimicrobiales bacterium]|nr:hypothetical protein [Longimicrobiales bacterium]
MAEPEDVLLEGAHFAATRIRELWARRAGAGDRPGLPDLRRRLELLVAAIFPGVPEIAVAEPPAPLTLLARLAGRTPAHLRPGVAFASTDGERIRLPKALAAVPAGERIARYRLLALEQAARRARGTAALLPARDRLLRDLFLLAEAASVDRLLAERLPGLVPDLRAARADALAARPDPPRATPRERIVEAALRSLLAAEPATPPAGFPAADSSADSPAGSLEWARREAERIRTLPGRYRGVAAVELWGAASPAPDAAAGEAAAPDAAPESGQAAPGRSARLRRRPRVREGGDDEDDASPGTWVVRADDPQESVEDPMGLQRPADRDAHADPDELADALSDLPEARLVRTPGTAREVLASDDPPPRCPPAESRREAAGIVYPEWDCREGAYHARGAVVRASTAPAGDGRWAERVLARNAAAVRRVRRDFERLRPRRVLLRRQPDGPEVDVDAYVTAYADARAGGVLDHRLYRDARPLRRDAATLLLVDASASTDGWLAGDRRIIDMEKEALLIVGEALAALGDPHAVLAFSGEGPARVELRTLKRFDEPAGPVVRRRVAALDADGYTRAGAAIRHATALLARQPSRHRLLLLVSDGRPNDVDAYAGRYGVEDTRQAVVEARLQGIHAFCLTVDREAPRYAAHVFGPGGYALLQRPERLPAALVDTLGRLLRR